MEGCPSSSPPALAQRAACGEVPGRTQGRPTAESGRRRARRGQPRRRRWMPAAAQSTRSAGSQSSRLSCRADRSSGAHSVCIAVCAESAAEELAGLVWLSVASSVYRRRMRRDAMNADQIGWSRWSARSLGGWLEGFLRVYTAQSGRRWSWRRVPRVGGEKLLAAAHAVQKKRLSSSRRARRRTHWGRAPARSSSSP